MTTRLPRSGMPGRTGTMSPIPVPKRPDPGARPRVLCVDDEPDLLAAITLNLRRRFDVVTATSGVDAIPLIAAADPPFAAVMSDMRMPEMDGAAFLSRCRELAPDTARLLLTGHADVTTAAAAVNEGEVFRLLTKPCMPETMLAALDAACAHHRRITIERDLMETTVHRCVQALIDLLGLTAPLAFGRAAQIRQHVTDVCDALAIRDRWHIEVAAMLSYIGWVTLPPETAEKLYFGHSIDTEERVLVAQMPEVVARLLGGIPRLEPVLALLSDRFTTASDERALAILRLARAFDALDAQGMETQLAIDTLRGRTGAHDAVCLDALARCRGASVADFEIRELPMSLVRVGMVFADDVRTTAGVMLVPRGYPVNEGFIARAGTFAPGYVRGPIRVRVKATRP